jgi:MFS family permease
MNQVRANSTRLSTGRILGALGMAPYEVLVQATISDLYFVHQRGTRIAVWNLFLLCGICGAGFVSGYIIEDLGYKWTFGVCAILFGIFGFGILFFVPETNYIRNDVTSKILAKTGIQHQERGAEDEKFDEKGMHVEAHPVALPTVLTGNGSNPDAATESKMSYMKSLRLYTGRYTDAPVWKIFARPFVMFFYPCVIWAFLIYGTTLTWIVYVWSLNSGEFLLTTSFSVFSVVNGVLFTSPPYNFSVGEAGLTSLSPFILCIIGEAISGPLNDYICVKLARRNHGVYEPEFRL